MVFGNWTLVQNITQVTDVGGTVSEPKGVTYGVPQARFDTWSSIIPVICN